MSGEHMTELEFMHRISQEFYCMVDFMMKLLKLFKNLSEKYDWGDDLNGTVKEMELLCHNFLELRKMWEKNK
jgi:hypothetical protein